MTSVDAVDVVSLDMFFGFYWHKYVENHPSFDQPAELEFIVMRILQLTCDQLPCGESGGEQSIGKGRESVGKPSFLLNYDADQYDNFLKFYKFMPI